MRIWIIGILLLGFGIGFGQIGLSGSYDGDRSEAGVYSQHTMLSTFTVNKTPLLNPFRTPWLEPRSPQGTVMSQYCIPDYQPQHYGFFCRVESKIERKSKLAPRFRLGSVNYVDALEGKYVPIVK